MIDIIMKQADGDRCQSRLEQWLVRLAFPLALESYLFNLMKLTKFQPTKFALSQRYLQNKFALSQRYHKLIVNLDLLSLN